MKTDFVSLLAEARRRVETSVLFKRFINHTPLENDIAVWMADFAQEAIEAAQREARETCGTCKFGRVRTVDDNGKAARQCHHPTLRYRFDREGLGVDTDFPETFGCTLHEPLATPDVGSTAPLPSPLPASPADETEQG